MLKWINETLIYYEGEYATNVVLEIKQKFYENCQTAERFISQEIPQREQLEVRDEVKFLMKACLGKAG